ncbi:MAG: barstar family protein [Dermatophilaceae bacterium]
MRHLGPDASVHELVATAHARGRAVRVIEGGVDRHSAFVAFAEGLGLPAWFGNNLDALVDALREVADEDGRTVEVIWDGAARLRTVDPTSFDAICAVLADVERERTDLDVTVVDR